MTIMPYISQKSALRNSTEPAHRASQNNDRRSRLRRVLEQLDCDAGADVSGSPDGEGLVAGHEEASERYIQHAPLRTS
jgi:hypothetical protein